MTMKYFEKRFGMVAVEKGLVTAEQVVDAMAVQIDENMEQKKHRFIGTVLVEQGYMRHSQIEEVLKSMDITDRED
jgi:acyl-coenzyme A synthetase/AMP-(fatty) acid ligase